MGYNMYWNGELLIAPPLTVKQNIELVDWLALDKNDRKIEDDDLTKLYETHGWKIYTPWCPVSEVKDDYLLFDSDGLFVEPMALIIRVLLDKFLIPWEKTVHGAIFWDGDEQEDIGKLVVKDGEVWDCPASIVYSEPGDPDTQEIKREVTDASDEAA